jgi:hypothetical protein
MEKVRMKLKKTRESKSRLTLAACLLLVLGGVLSSVSADGPSPPEQQHRDLEAPDEVLPIGKECVLALEQSGAGQLELAGRLDRANERWLVLHVEQEGRSEVGTPVLSKIPYTNRLFKNVGIGRTREDYWIPRERLLYLRVADANFERTGIDFDENARSQETQVE